MRRKGKRVQTKCNASFLCQYCGELYSMENNLKSHILNNHEPCEKIKQSLFKCRHCEYYSKSVLGIEKHLVLFHKSNTEQAVNRTFICDYCNFIFKMKGNLVCHIQNIHIQNKELMNKCVSCDYCKSYFKNSIWLGRHITQCHIKKEENVKDIDANDINNVISNLQALNSQCQPDILAQAIDVSGLCLSPLNIVENKGENYKINNKSDILARAIGTSRLEFMPDIDISKLVVRRENGVNMINCNLCSFISNKLSLLKRHFVTHFKREFYQCRQCPATFRYLCKFEEHNKHHKPEHQRRIKAKRCHKRNVANASQWEIKILEPANELEKESSCLNTSFMSLDNTIFSVDDSILDDFMNDIPSDILPSNLSDIDQILNKRSISQKTPVQNEYYKECNKIHERMSFRDNIKQLNQTEISENNINSIVFDTNEHSTFTINNNIQIEVIECNGHNANSISLETSHALRDHDYIVEYSFEIDNNCSTKINSKDANCDYNNILYNVNDDFVTNDINNKIDSDKEFHVLPHNVIESYNYTCDMKTISNSRAIDNIIGSLPNNRTTDEKNLQNIIPNVFASEKPPITFTSTDNQVDLCEATIANNSHKNAQLYPNTYNGSNVNDKFAFTNIISTSINKNSNEITICHETFKDPRKDFLTSDTFDDCDNDSGAVLQPQWEKNTNPSIYHNLTEGNNEDIPLCPTYKLKQLDLFNIDNPSYILANDVLPTHENHFDLNMITPQTDVVDDQNFLKSDIMCYNNNQLQDTLNTERNLSTDCNIQVLDTHSPMNHRTELNKNNAEVTITNTNMEINDYLSLNERDVMQGPISMSILDMTPDSAALSCYVTENAACTLNNLNIMDNIENILNEEVNIAETTTQSAVQHCDDYEQAPQTNALDDQSCLNSDIMCYNINQLQDTLNTERNLAIDCNIQALDTDSSTDHRTDLNKNNAEVTIANTNMEINDYLLLNGKDVTQGISMKMLEITPDNAALPCYVTENAAYTLNNLNTMDNIDNIMNEEPNIPKTITQSAVQHYDDYEEANIADIDSMRNGIFEDIPDTNTENNDKMMLKLLSQQTIKAFIKSECEHVCGTCFKRFKTNKNLKEHIEIVHSNLNFSCEHCGKTLRSKQSLKVHIKSHFAPSKIECQVCAKAVAPMAMTVHMRLHNNHTPFLCILCEKKFRNFTSKKQHIIKYHLKKESKSSKTTLMDMICEINEPEILNVQKSVSILKKYANDIIEKRTIKKAVTEKPQSKKEIEKVTCEVCNKVYVNSAGLKRHSKLHSRPNVKCDLCYAEFENKRKLSMHKYRLHNPHKRTKPLNENEIIYE